MLSRKEIFKKALQLRAAGHLYDLNSVNLDDDFRGSVDRFCLIAHKFQGKKRVLDVGSGNGILLSLLHELGHECYGLDVVNWPQTFAHIYQSKSIKFHLSNVEVDSIPYPDNFFDAVCCCQVLEHFTHSHLPAVKDMHRVLKSCGVLEIDVPNVVCFRNRSRMIRGKNITWDYKEHYLHEKILHYKNMTFCPTRHNREFTIDELRLLLGEAGFREITASFLKSRRHRTGFEKIRSLGSMLRDLVPSFRKSLIAFAVK